MDTVGARHRLVLGLIAGIALFLALFAYKGAEPAFAGTCQPYTGSGWYCTWNCNPQPAATQCWFSGNGGGSNARNWYHNTVNDTYVNGVHKCASAVRASNGNRWSNQCGYYFVVNDYNRCNCGGLYVRHWNGASGARKLLGAGYH